MIRLDAPNVIEGLRVAPPPHPWSDDLDAFPRAVIEGVRAAGNYAIIFDVSAPNNGIVTADKSLDLTQRVIQQLKAGS